MSGSCNFDTNRAHDPNREDTLDLKKKKEG